MNEHALTIEAESFNDLGGWTLDTQYTHSMGLPYPPRADSHAGDSQEEE